MLVTVVDVLAVVCTFLVIFFEYCKWARTYWQNRNVICLEEQLTLKNFPKLFWKKFNSASHVDEIYKELKKNGLKHGGAYFLNEPVYVPASVEFLEKVLVDKSTDLCPEYNELEKSSASLLNKIPTNDLNAVLGRVELRRTLERSSGVKIGPKIVTELFLKELVRTLDGGDKIDGLGMTSKTLYKCLEEIAKNRDSRREIASLMGTQEMPGANEEIRNFLDAVILETIRMYPVVPFLTKKCLNPLTIPGTDVTLERGTKVLVPVSGIHSDPDNFMEPDFFNPQRFQRDNLPLIQKVLYWNPYSKKEMDFLKGSLEVLIHNGVLKAI